MAFRYRFVTMFLGIRRRVILDFNSLQRQKTFPYMAVQPVGNWGPPLPASIQKPAPFPQVGLAVARWRLVEGRELVVDGSMLVGW